MKKSNIKKPCRVYGSTCSLKKYQKLIDKNEKLETKLNQALYKRNYEYKEKIRVLKKLDEIKKSNAYQFSLHIKNFYKSPKEFLSFIRFTGNIILKKFKFSQPMFLKELQKKNELKQKTRKKNELLRAALTINKSNGSSYYNKFSLNVAIITDEFMYNYYKGAFENMFWVTPANYQSIFTNQKIDLFIYVSCWKGGIDNEWRGHVRNEKLQQDIENIIHTCKSNNIKTVFQTIEDPSNYDHFLPIAKKFDVVLTSDEDILFSYKQECPNSIVDYMEYGVNPEFNNPIGSVSSSTKDSFFAGSYPSRYQERCQDMVTVFNSIIKSDIDLVIADRNHNLNLDQYAFPDKYQSCVVSGFEHKVLQNVHKLFKMNINFNSIKHSSTMCAMRVYELQAQNTMILSNYAKSVTNNFPSIFILNHEKNIRTLVSKLNDIFFYEQRIRALRNIMCQKTVYHQTSKLLEHANINKTMEKIHVAVYITGDAVKVQDQVLTSEIEVDYFHINNLSEIINQSNVQQNKYNFIAFLGNDYEYEEFYLQDMLNAFKYVDVEFVTKLSYFQGTTYHKNIEHDYVTKVDDIFKTVINTKKVPSDTIQNIIGNNKKILSQGYSIDPFNLNTEKYYQLQNTSSEKQKEYLLSIIIPVYNNGNFLEDRCFKSLLVNNSFNDFEIIIVDDGSTDVTTKKIIQKINKCYANVLLHEMPLPASGTASRARNKGIELASSPYVSFLDPDNSISIEGYDNIVKLTKQYPTYDAVIGYQYKIAKSTNIIGRLFADSFKIVNNPKEVLLEKNFPAISTQASAVKKSLLIDNNIDYIEKAIGQDTTFGYEILAASENIIFTHEAYIEYYAERAGSVTNTIDISFFERSLILEKEQKLRLQKWGVWDIYLKKRAVYFVENWYITKLELIDDVDYMQSIKIVEAILEINEMKNYIHNIRKKT